MDQCGGKDEYQLPEATDERGYKKCNGEQGGEEECGEMRSCWKEMELWIDEVEERWIRGAVAQHKAKRWECLVLSGESAKWVFNQEKKYETKKIAADVGSSYNRDKEEEKNKRRASLVKADDVVIPRIQGCREANDSRSTKRKWSAQEDTSLDCFDQGATRQGTSLGFVQRGRFRFVHR
jgi:hypothetical protein